MKKITRRNFLKASATVSAVGALAACSTTDTTSADTTTTSTATSSDDTAATKQGETLQVWTWSPPTAEDFAPVLAMFEEQTGHKVELTVVESADYQKKAPLALTSNEEIDALLLQPNMVSELKLFLEDLEPYMDAIEPDWKSNYNATDLEQCLRPTVGDGVLYALSCGSIADWVVYYNADLINDMGLTLPETFEDWKNFNDAIRAYDDSIIPFGYWGADAHIYYQTSCVLSGQLSDHVNRVRYEGAAYNDGDFVNGISYLLRMFYDGIVPYNEVSDLNKARCLELFAEGKLATYMDGSFGANILSKEYRDANGYNFDVGAFVFPIAEEGNLRSMRTFINNTIGIVNYSEKKDAAAEFVRFMTLGDGSTHFADEFQWFTSVLDYEADTSKLSTEASLAGYNNILEGMSYSLVSNVTRQPYRIPSHCLLARNAICPLNLL